MRWTLSRVLLCAAFLAPVIGAPPAENAGVVKDSKQVALNPDESNSADSKDGKDASDGSTVFNGQRVPPITMLDGGKLKDEIEDGYWLVEFFSPWCHHCKALAPIWQTFYEFYYTSNPVPGSSEKPKDLDRSPNSFTRYYDLKFAKLDCVAYGSACEENGITNYPTIILFKDGKEVKKTIGFNKLAFFSEWLEQSLESIKPGSRPKNGPRLPKVGASSVDEIEESTDDADANVKDKSKDPARGAAAGESHNAKATTTAADDDEMATAAASTAKSTSKATSLSATHEVPNPHGSSVPLSAESFQRLVTTTHDPWFVKFYAPWCHHCQAMAPNWAGMAREMKGKLNIGEVNCDIEKRLCKDVRVRAFPTIHFFRGGERVEYEGLRGLGDFVDFAGNAVEFGAGVADVDWDSFRKMEETEEVIFLYFYDHATTSEDLQALDRLVLSLIGHAKLVKTNDPKLAERFKISTWPRLVVSRDGKPTYFNALSPRDMRDFRKVLEWMRSVWLPIVPELTASNAREIMAGKLVVLGVLSRERSDEFVIAKREIKNAALEWIDKQTQAFNLERQELRDAKQLRIEEAEDRNDQRALRSAKQIRINMDEIKRKEVGFAWVDGVFWERWIRTTYGIDVKDGEKVVVNDEDNRRYWDTTITGNPIVPSRTSILETLPKLISHPPKLAPKSHAGLLDHARLALHTLSLGHPWLALGVIIGLAVGLAVLGRSRMWRRGRGGGGAWGQGGLLRLDGEKGFLGGLGNGSVGGKVD
ncbi:MAG: hypothetical protein M1822_005091 [Bathelium mastoideum]|nr:MAG: hypothetical protein M1822_005091 [Bathelium mastoideum]